MGDQVDLPVKLVKPSLMKHLQDSELQCLMLIGETACGKSTQIPQYILDANINRGRLIGVTQPRRIAAISLANRVAEERGEMVGGTVGYAVRFDEKISSSTKLKYMTDGILLKESLTDKTFSRYSCIILDEVHERTLNNDILLGLLKNALDMRNGNGKSKKVQNPNPLKLILMSATVDLEPLFDYFGERKTLAVFVAGRQFDVQTYSVARTTDYLTGTIQLIFKLHRELPIEDHILAFLPGQEDIEYAVGVLKMSKLEKSQILPLYSALSQEAQLKAICRPTEGFRRIVISTNIAETSLTIPGISVVLDCGYVKRKVLVTRLECQRLELERISKAESYQRSGRAGREKDGVCYRFFTNSEFNDLNSEPDAEVKRSNLNGVILQLLRLGVVSPSQFHWLDPPAPNVVSMARFELKELKAVTGDVEPLSLTPLGKNLAELPLEPKFGKVLIAAYQHGLVDAVATIFGILSSENIYVREVSDDVINARSVFLSPMGDLFTYLNIIKEFRHSKAKIQFCQTYKFNLRSLRFALKVRKQLVKHCLSFTNVKAGTKKGMDENKIRDLILQAMPRNIAQLQGDVKYYVRRGNNEGVEVKIHPSSVMAGKRLRTLHFADMIQLGEETFITHITYLDQTPYGNFPKKS